MTDDELLALGLKAMIVARGRSVQGPVPGTGRPDPDNPNRVIGVTSKTYRSGSTVWLTPDEAPRLRDLGYVLDPERDAQIVSAMFAPAPAPDAPTVLNMVPAEAFNLRAVGNH
ncbi:hypothetical protein P5W99_30030 [Paraburkholderia sp. A3BS-1L]|uniref:hypothetical protein n=1 Tax=Paraburkholderia sp. A3BS-1L TaxID=3028375 RepID=UPI003DA89657